MARQNHCADESCIQSVVMHPIERIANRYPQVCFPIDPATKDSALYRAAVLRGKRDGLQVSGFTFDPRDTLSTAETPEGPADVLYLENRADFERCIRALAYRCEPRAIPPSMGASTLIGLINWEKIDRHRAEYRLSGGSDWSSEFARYTADPKNYRDMLIVVGSGFYSAVPPEQMGLTEGAWLQRSLTIRTNHELTHFVFRKRFPDNTDAIRDEVIADAVGLMTAFGKYDPDAAKRFLGIEGARYRAGGRLENYLGQSDSLSDAIRKANETIDCVSKRFPPEKQGIDFAACIAIVSKVLN